MYAVGIYKVRDGREDYKYFDFSGEGSLENPFTLGSSGAQAQQAAITTKTASIIITAAGDNTIITPTSGKAIRITALYFTCSSTIAITLKAGTTAISGAMPLIDHAADYSYPMALNVEQNFVINTSTAGSVNGYVNYFEV